MSIKTISNAFTENRANGKVVQKSEYVSSTQVVVTYTDGSKDQMTTDTFNMMHKVVEKGHGVQAVMNKLLFSAGMIAVVVNVLFGSHQSAELATFGIGLMFTVGFNWMYAYMGLQS